MIDSIGTIRKACKTQVYIGWQTCLLSSSFLIISNDVLSAENSIETRLSLTSQYDDNFRFAETQEEDLLGNIFASEISYRRVGNKNDIGVDGKFNIENFNREEYNDENGSISFSTGYTMESYRLNFEAGSQHLSTRTSELNDSGIVEDFASRRIDNDLSLLWQQQINERFFFSLTSSAHTTNYDSISFSDYKSYSLENLYSYELSARLSIFGQINFSDFQSRLFGNFPVSPIVVDNILVQPPQLSANGTAITDSFTFGSYAGVTWRIKENLEITSFVGFSEVDTTQTIDTPNVTIIPQLPLTDPVVFGSEKFDSSSQTRVFDTSLTYNRESSVNSFTLRQSVQPSSSGTFRIQEELQYSYYKIISEKDSFRSTLIGTINENLESNILRNTETERRFIQVNAEYRRKLYPKWRFSTILSYRQQDFIDIDRKSDSLFSLITIVFEPHKRVW